MTPDVYGKRIRPVKFQPVIRMLRSRASLAYWAESSRNTRANASALPPTGSVAVCSRLARIAASPTALPISALR